MKNEVNCAFFAKKKQYISPSIVEQNLYNGGVLCASGSSHSRITSSIVYGGDNGGDAADAF